MSGLSTSYSALILLYRVDKVSLLRYIALAAFLDESMLCHYNVNQLMRPALASSSAFMRLLCCKCSDAKLLRSYQLCGDWLLFSLAFSKHLLSARLEMTSNSMQ